MDPSAQIILISILFIIFLILLFILIWRRFISGVFLVIILLILILTFYYTEIDIGMYIVQKAISLRMICSMPMRIQEYHTIANTIFGEKIKMDSNLDKNLKGVIYISNYRDNIMEYMIPGTFKNLYLVAKRFSQNDRLGKFANFIYHPDHNYLIVETEGGHYDSFKDKIKNLILAGFSIYVYPEGLVKGERSHKYDLKPFRVGIFNIAKDFNIKIVPLVNDYVTIKHLQGKRYKQIQGEICNPIKFKSGENIKDHVRNWMLEELNKLSLDC